SAAGLGAGDYVIAWSDELDSTIHGRLVTALGEPRLNPVSNSTDDFTISTITGGSAYLPEVASTGTPHGFVAVWRTDTGLRARFFASDGSAQTPGETGLATYSASVSLGGPHVAWRGDAAAVAWWVNDPADADLDTGAVLLRLFAPPGGAAAGPVRVLARPIDDPGVSPDVAVLPDGTIGVAWHDCGDGSDGAGCAIRFQALRPSGLPIGDPIVANTTTAGDQTDPALTAVGDDVFALTWTDESAAAPDTSDAAIRARLIYPLRDPDDGRIGARCGGAGDAACGSGLTCMAGTAGSPLCHESCDPAAADPCPLGGTCTTEGPDSACLF
ncbi:MAG TPA: hypothetical protein VL172_07960, partial [Kofleriaceae bacterium]|nr:hypothetical protein [Kofleriaceae bacterium]